MADFFGEDFTEEELLEQRLLEEQFLGQQRVQEERQRDVQEGRNVKRDQDIDFLESLHTDQMRDLHREREKQRQLIANLLTTKLPTTIMDLIPKEDQRLLRIRDVYLTPEEKIYVQGLKEEIARLENGGCLDIEEGPNLFKLRIPGVTLTLCFDIEDIFEQGLVNENLVIADVNIDLNETGELYRYPLSEEETGRLITQARSLGLNLDQYPKLTSSEIEEIEETRGKLYQAYAE